MVCMREKQAVYAGKTGCVRENQTVCGKPGSASGKKRKTPAIPAGAGCADRLFSLTIRCKKVIFMVTKEDIK